jgi:DNA-binding CsgD family transcriptional regulator
MHENPEEQFKNLFQELIEKEQKLQNRISFLENFISRNNLYFLVFDREEHIMYHNLPGRKNIASLSDAEYILQKDIITRIRNCIAMPPSDVFEVTLKSTILEFILFTHEDSQGLFFLQVTLFNHQRNMLLNSGDDREYSRAETGFNDLRSALDLLDEIRSIESAKQKKELYREIQGHYLPALAQLRNSNNDPIIDMCIEIIQNNLREVIAPSGNISTLYKILTPSEIKVAEFIRMGKSSQDIAEALDIARKTVENHRNSLRDKLGLRNKSVNLRSYLLNLDTGGAL